MTRKPTPGEGLPVLHTPDEVAKPLGRSGWWVREQCRRDRFPHTRAAGSIRFTREQFDEILRILERRPEPSPQRGQANTRRFSRKTTVTDSVAPLRSRPQRRAQAVSSSDDIGRTA